MKFVTEIMVLSDEVREYTQKRTGERKEWRTIAIHSGGSRPIEATAESKLPKLKELGRYKAQLELVPGFRGITLRVLDVQEM